MAGSPGRSSSRRNRSSTRRARPRLPASELYLIANNRLTPEFQTTERSLIFVLGHSIAVGVQSMLRMNIDRAYGMAKRNGIPFYLSYPALGADQQGKGAFDTEFMTRPVRARRRARQERPALRAGSRRGAARLGHGRKIAGTDPATGC